MIGHYLLALTKEQEDRVLTTKLAYAPSFIRLDGCRCLVGTVKNAYFDDNKHVTWSEDGPRATWFPKHVGKHFDEVCKRFGEERVNAAIRNRILANRARRLLQQPKLEEVSA